MINFHQSQEFIRTDPTERSEETVPLIQIPQGKIFKTNNDILVTKKIILFRRRTEIIQTLIPGMERLFVGGSRIFLI